MIHRSAAQGYRRRSQAYRSARPTYHPDLVDRFLERYGRGTVVELGAGTGIFTRQLRTAGLDPIAVEPVAEMRAVLAADRPDGEPTDGTVIEGTAERTGLGDRSADTVVAAQAFHWFDHPRALGEIGRILRPGGHLVCVWNVRDDTVPWMEAYTEVVDRHAGDTPRHRTMVWRQAIDDDPAFEPVDDWSVGNPTPTDAATVAERVLSTSFIAALDEPTQQAVLGEIAAITAPLGPTFDFPYRAELQAWHLLPQPAD